MLIVQIRLSAKGVVRHPCSDSHVNIYVRRTFYTCIVILNIILVKCATYILIRCTFIYVDRNDGMPFAMLQIDGRVNANGVKSC